ncbi:hypothetical protein SAMN06265348_10391 [Pedobacter westerhofensis]|uniref:Outer membrane protein beta-barrel domain-containing protein n=1 Tax=Pedobacter westerhofensis TaxID=425512 RepID=A0A521BZB5_9SPHI|nr:hypothetical protein [Pedobacter westerhofensis]SMO52435.1 hypothetical protein SAMN06265348_10391 [Pedobacter westerhofensis]
MKKCCLLVLLLIFCKISVQAQNDNTDTPADLGKSIFGNEVKRNFSRKGDFYFHWGYNHSWYGKSDIRFQGPGYDFTLKDVVAHDRQSKLSWDYLNPGLITVPQYNIRFGYFFADNWSVSLAWDHMKYVMDIPQTVAITGTIGASISDPGVPTGALAGTYNGQMINVTPQMLTYEHTDGFNYANIELERYDDIWVAPSRETSLTLETGIGGGMMVPRSDVRLFEQGRNNHWNISGYGFSVKAGLKFYITKFLYLQNTTKLGATNLKNVHTTGRDDVDKASQKINYTENLWVLGYQF